VIPIIFISTRALIDDKIEGYNRGADDYIVKPFNMRELLLKLDVFLRRTRKLFSEVKSEFTIGKIFFSHTDLKFESPDGVLKLKQKEADLLQFLCMHPNKILKRDEILLAVWGKDDYFLGRSMDVFMSKLQIFKSRPSSGFGNHTWVGIQIFCSGLIFFINQRLTCPFKLPDYLWVVEKLGFFSICSFGGRAGGTGPIFLCITFCTKWAKILNLPFLNNLRNFKNEYYDQNASNWPIRQRLCSKHSKWKKRYELHLGSFRKVQRQSGKHTGKNNLGRLCLLERPHRISTISYQRNSGFCRRTTRSKIISAQ
jgi:hypothetical protein